MEASNLKSANYSIITRLVVLKGPPATHKPKHAGGATTPSGAVGDVRSTS